MRVLRLLAVGSVFGLSVLTIGFACVDRLTHGVAPPAPILARAPQNEPAATGSITQAPPPIAALKKAPKAMDGFDTERLNALMRGDPLAPRR